ATPTRSGTGDAAGLGARRSAALRQGLEAPGVVRPRSILAAAERCRRGAAARRPRRLRQSADAVMTDRPAGMTLTFRCPPELGPRRTWTPPCRVRSPRCLDCPTG